MKKKLIPLVLICFCLIMVLFPQITVKGSKTAIDLWLSAIVPTMLPFFIITNFMKAIGMADKVPATIYPFVMATVSGYPIGAKIAGEYYRDGYMNFPTYKYILSYSMVTGPAFIIGAVGLTFLGSYKWGVVIALGHYLGALANGVLYKPTSKSSQPLSKPPHLTVNSRRLGNSSTDYFTILTDSIKSSFMSMAIILAYIIIFMIIVAIVDKTMIFQVIDDILPGNYGAAIEGLSKSLLEMTVGCNVIGNGINSNLLASTCASFAISFGGLSVIGQTLSMSTGTGISPFTLIKMKLTHGMLSAVLTFSFGTFVLYF